MDSSPEMIRVLGGWSLYILPVIPLITRGWVAYRFRSVYSEHLSEEELDRESHRTHLQILTGFAFSAVIALAVLQEGTQFDLVMPVYFLCLSFAMFWWSWHLQAYKSRRWEDQAASTCADVASLSLFLAVLAVLLKSDLPQALAVVFGFLTLVVWGMDHVLRLTFLWGFLSKEPVATGGDHDDRIGTG